MRHHITTAFGFCTVLLVASCANPSDVGSVPNRTGPTTPVTPVNRPGTPGSVTTVDPGSSTTSGPGTTLSDPAINNNRVGRSPKRLNVRQLRAAYASALGVTWQQPQRVASADYVGGSAVLDTDMFDFLARTLGRPDYNAFTHESIEPNAVFSKLVGDAARKACRDAITADLTLTPGLRHLLRFSNETDTWATNETAVRRNIAHLMLRFWSRTVAPTDPIVTQLGTLFTTAATAPASTMPALQAGTAVDGWRTVCIALATDNEFLTY
jgi:hypothetical protein